MSFHHLNSKIVNKTGGAAELELFKMLCEYVSKYPLVKEHS